jgi:hypothetical protein
MSQSNYLGSNRIDDYTAYPRSGGVINTRGSPSVGNMGTILNEGQQP